jgi:hypothetical protein
MAMQLSFFGYHIRVLESRAVDLPWAVEEKKGLDKKPCPQEMTT